VLLPSASRPSQLLDASSAALFLTWSKDAFEVVDAVAGEQQGANEIGCVQGPAHTSFMSLELTSTSLERPLRYVWWNMFLNINLL
jgi:hypothetical protein